MKKITLVLILLLTIISSYGQTNYYVSATGNDTNDGLSTDTPKATLNNVRGSTSDGDIINIDGNGGTYSVSSQFNISKNLTIQGINGAVVQGWASTGPRMFNLNLASKTVVIKDLIVRGMSNTASGTVFNIPVENSNLTIDNCVFENNYSTGNGGVLNMIGASSTLTIKNCYFDGGSAAKNANQGGAVYVNVGTSDVTIMNSTFRNHTVGDKGVIFIIAETFTGVNLTIADNECTNTAAGAAAGIHFQTIETSAVLQNSIVYNNTTPNTEVGIHKNLDISAAGASFDVLNKMKIQNSIIETVTNSIKDAVNIDNTGTVWGFEDGSGAPIIDGWAFNSSNNVYEYNDASYPVLWGDASFLTDLVDQLGNVRTAVDGKIDAGAWQSAHANKRTLSIESFELLESGFTIYPNPVILTARIIAPTANNEIIEIFSILGQKVQEVKVVNGEAIMDVQNLGKGIYFAKMKIENSSISKKFVVTK